MNKKTYIVPEVKQTILMPEQPMFENKSIDVDNGSGGVSDDDDDFEMTRPFFYDWVDKKSDEE